MRLAAGGKTIPYKCHTDGSKRRRWSLFREGRQTFRYLTATRSLVLPLTRDAHEGVWTRSASQQTSREQLTETGDLLFIMGAENECVVGIWESYDESEVVALGEFRLTEWASAVSEPSVPGGIRTPDILLRRQALYPLSYRHILSYAAF